MSNLPKNLYLTTDVFKRPIFISGTSSKGIKQKLLKTLSIVDTETFEERENFAKRVIESYNNYEEIEKLRKHIVKLEEALRFISEEKDFQGDKWPKHGNFVMYSAAKEVLEEIDYE